MSWWRECPRRRSTVATRRFGVLAEVEFDRAGRSASQHVRKLKTLSGPIIITLEGSDHDEMPRGGADDWFGGIFEFPVDNRERGVVHWVPNKEVKQGRRSIYRSRPRLLRIWSKLGSRRWRDIFTKASSPWHAMGQSPMAIPGYTPQLATTW
jgi:hypothetical protein